MAAKAWKIGRPGAPAYPDDFEILRKAVLQKTDLKNNNNKYYAIELHKAASGASPFRVFTHYGRTDDLETKPNAGTKEARFFQTAIEAEAEYQRIFGEKTAKSKGYKEVSLASSKIGSQKARGTSAGKVDAETLKKIAGAPPAKASSLPLETQDLVRRLYDEATQALTSTVQATITAQGIETPLGVLTLGQVQKGEAILDEAFKIFQGKTKDRATRLEALSGDFYSAIPHRLGRSRQAIQAAVIDSLSEFQAKQDLLQLMKDMLEVNGDKNVLFDAEIDAKYKALGCAMTPLDDKSDEFNELADYVLNSQVKSRDMKLSQIFKLQRAGEWDNFKSSVGNHRLLFHGSRAPNWVGILSRGILLPKIVVSLGVNRTDAGWLGSGIYFGDAACTSAFYTSPSKDGWRYMAVARVALGKVMTYRKITYGLSEPPAGYNSCHGVRRKQNVESEFDDDEFVIYDAAQQRLEYLIEFQL